MCGIADQCKLIVRGSRENILLSPMLKQDVTEIDHEDPGSAMEYPESF